MINREKTIELWFRMWLEGKDSGIENIFSPDCIYTESWGPQYIGLEKIKFWFAEWNKDSKVLVWDIKRYLHDENHTAVEWYFKYTMNNGMTEDFDGVSIIEWTDDGKIKSLKEFGCKLPHYYPYENK